MLRQYIDMCIIVTRIPDKTRDLNVGHWYIDAAKTNTSLGAWKCKFSTFQEIMTEDRSTNRSTDGQAYSCRSYTKKRIRENLPLCMMISCSTLSFVVILKAVSNFVVKSRVSEPEPPRAGLFARSRSQKNYEVSAPAPL